MDYLWRSVRSGWCLFTACIDSLTPVTVKNIFIDLTAQMASPAPLTHWQPVFMAN